MSLRRVVVAVFWTFACSAFSFAAEPQHLDLSGTWQLRQDDQASSIAATVPGEVYSALMDNKIIGDPFYRDAEKSLQWVANANWTYLRTVNVSADLRNREHILLRCEGLDTVATITINGSKLADTDNMFRTYELDAKRLLKAGENRIEITFHPVKPYIEQFIKNAPKVPNATSKDMGNVRKAPYANGWDFGPKFLNAGIYKKIEIVAFDTARLQTVRIDTDVSSQSATVDLHPVVDGTDSANLKCDAELKIDSKPIATISGPADHLALTIPHPQLWWPAGYGKQPLYELTVTLRDSSGNPIDHLTRRIGLRKIELLPKSDDRPLRLAVNGREIYAKGVNWIPCDMFTSRVTPQRLHQFIADAIACNMNCIRTWGGGYYEEDAFYDACDELGLMVWSEFKFACAAYPAGNPAFADNVRKEIGDQVDRLQHHPSIAVWSGNNECESLVKGYKVISQEEYDHLFHAVIGEKFKKTFPSGFGNFVGGSPEAGDEHNWWVWHIGADFEKYRESHGWMTEFGFQSWPNPHTVDSFTDESDRKSVLDDVMMSHQHNKNGNKMILDQMAKYFRPAKDFDSALWLSQINQGWGMMVGIEHWRTDWPKSSGSFVWQYNDDAPAASWSAVDYYGHWKAAMYRYRKAYAPLMITGIINAKDATADISIANDLPTETTATVHWSLTDAQGESIANGSLPAKIPAGTSAMKLPTLQLKSALKNHDNKDDLLLWLSLDNGANKAVSTKLLTFSRFKNLPLIDPNLTTTVRSGDGGFDVTLKSESPALFAWLDCADADAKYSDNFIDLDGRQAVTIHVTPSKAINIEIFKKTLKAYSLFDTYDHDAAAAVK